MNDWTRRPYRNPGSALTFPRDEGWHQLGRRRGERALTDPSMLRMEWAYLNAHVDEVGGEGRRFVVFVAYFTQWLRFLVVRAWDREDRYLGTWTGTTLGRLYACEDRHDLEFRHPGGVDSWVARGESFDSELYARDDADGFSVALSLTNTRRPYEAGGSGYLPFAKNGWFSYWSLTRLRVAGTLELTRCGAARETVKVSGLGWFDHQWGDFTVTPFRLPGFEEYEWLSVQLDSGEDLMLTTVWEPHGETPSLDAYGGVGVVFNDHDPWARVIGPEAITRTRFWRSIEQDAVYAAGWRVKVEAWELELDITPRHPDQLTPIFDATAPALSHRAMRGLLGPFANWFGSFWEGSCRVTGTLKGRAVTGVAFAELIKRYRDPVVRIQVAREERGFTVVAWRVKHADPEAPLGYRVTVESPRGEVLWASARLDVCACVLDHPDIPRGRDLTVRVVAATDDGVLRGEDTRSLVLGR